MLMLMQLLHLLIIIPFRLLKWFTQVLAYLIFLFLYNMISGRILQHCSNLQQQNNQNYPFSLSDWVEIKTYFFSMCVWEWPTFKTCGGKSTPICNGTLSGAFEWSACGIGFDWLEKWPLAKSLPSVEVDGVGDDAYNCGMFVVQFLGTCNCCAAFVVCDECAICELWSMLAHPAVPLDCIGDSFRSFSRRSSSWRSSSCNCSRCNCCLSCVRLFSVAVLNVGLFISRNERKQQNQSKYYVTEAVFNCVMHSICISIWYLIIDNCE